MPKLPTYDSQRQLTIQQPQFLAPRSTEAERLGAIGEVAGRAADIAVKWNNALNTIQATTAKANYEMGALDILDRAANDTDYNNSKLYMDDLNKLRTESLKGFSSKANESRVALELDYAKKATEIKIGNIFKKKAIAAGQVAVQQRINAAINNPHPKSDKVIKALIDEQIAAGIFGEIEGYNLYVKSVKQLRENMFLQDLQASPAQAKKNLSKNIYGFTIEEKEKAETIYDREVQVIRDANEDALIDLQLNGELGVEYVKEQRKNGFIDANFAKSMIKDLESVKYPVAESLENARVFNELSGRELILKRKEKGWGNADFAQRAQFKADVIEAHAKGKISDKERDEFLKNPNKNLRTDPKVQNALSAIKEHAELSPTVNEAVMMEAQLHHDFIEKIIGGMNPDDALKATIDERNKADNPDWTDYELNQVLTLESGTWKVVGFKANGEPILELMQ